MGPWSAFSIKSYSKLTPNQLVAYNLFEARALRGWTQEDAAKELEPYLGKKWTKATFSAAEHSVDGERVRKFSGDEIAAFARGFQLPVAWFFLPPDPGHTDDELEEKNAIGEQLANIVGSMGGAIEFKERTERIYDRFPEFRARYGKQLEAGTGPEPSLEISELQERLNKLRGQAEAHRRQLGSLIDWLMASETAGRGKTKRADKQRSRK